MSSTHGGLNYKALEEEGIDPSQVKDFSVSINPEPLPDSVYKAFREAPIERYPDSSSNSLRQEISKAYGIPGDEIMVVNGTSQGVFLLAGAFLSHNDKWLLSGPTYSEYADACRLYSSHEIRIDSHEEQGFYPDINKLCTIITEEKPALLWLCSPNNPTGSVLHEEDFHSLRKCALSQDCLIILDEAYRCFLPDSRQYDTVYPGVVNMRSMTKDFSIPGLRLGYIRAESHILDKLKARQPEWSVSAPAQEAGAEAIRNLPYFKKTWQTVVSMTEEFRQDIEAEGYQTFPTGSNFFLVKVPDLEALKKALWHDLILVRDCTSFGLNNIMRLGTRSKEDNARLVKILKREKS